MTLSCIIKYPPTWFISALYTSLAYVHKAAIMILLKWRSNTIISLFKSSNGFLRLRNKDPPCLQSSTWPGTLYHWPYFLSLPMWLTTPQPHPRHTSLLAVPSNRATLTPDRTMAHSLTSFRLLFQSYLLCEGIFHHPPYLISQCQSFMSPFVLYLFLYTYYQHTTSCNICLICLLSLECNPHGVRSACPLLYSQCLTRGGHTINICGKSEWVCNWFVLCSTHDVLRLTQKHPLQTIVFTLPLVSFISDNRTSLKFHTHLSRFSSRSSWPGLGHMTISSPITVKREWDHLDCHGLIMIYSLPLSRWLLE